MDRVEVAYEPLYQRFLVKQRTYAQQYSHIYTRRTGVLRSLLTAAASAKWKADARHLHACGKIVDLSPGDNEWIVIGCIYKEQPLKPSVLDEFSNEKLVEPPRPRANYTSSDDSLIIEDESGRATLAAGTWPRGTPAAGKRFPVAALRDCLSTGVVIAVRAHVLPTGELAVNDVCFAGAAPLPSPARSLPPAASSVREPCYLLLLSGLSVGTMPSETDNDHTLALQLLLDYVSGYVPLGGDDRATASAISRIIIAGNSIGRASTVVSAGRSITSSAASAATFATGDAAADRAVKATRSAFSDRTLSVAEQEAIAIPVRDADFYLAQLAACARVDVMPGDADPANFTMPQQPMHVCLFPTAGRYSTFRSVSNPYDCRLGTTRIIGSSGQPVADLARYVSSDHVTAAGCEVPSEAAVTGTGSRAGAASSVDDADMAGAPDAASSLQHVQLLANTLQWRHMAPTAPDTLAAYPFYEVDPFVLSETEQPHIFFSGNAPEYGTIWVPGADSAAGGSTRVIAIPKFASCHTGVLVDLTSPTYEPQLISFACF